MAGHIPAVVARSSRDRGVRARVPQRRADLLAVLHACHVSIDAGRRGKRDRDRHTRCRRRVDRRMRRTVADGDRNGAPGTRGAAAACERSDPCTECGSTKAADDRAGRSPEQETTDAAEDRADHTADHRSGRSVIRATLRICVDAAPIVRAANQLHLGGSVRTSRPATRLSQARRHWLFAAARIAFAREERGGGAIADFGQEFIAVAREACDRPRVVGAHRARALGCGTQRESLHGALLCRSVASPDECR